MARVADETTMTQYLLDLLSEEEREQVEASFFQDDACFAQLASLEDDLIDDYVRGRLSDALQEAFERKLARDPSWKEQVLFAQALTRRIAESQSTAVRAPVRSSSLWQSIVNSFRTERFAFRFAVAVCSVLVVVSVSWMGWQVRRQRADMQALQAERSGLQNTIGGLQNEVAGLRQQDQNLSRELDEERARRQELETRPQQPGALGLMASFILSPGVVRGADTSPRIAIPTGARTVRLQLDLETAGEYAAYRVHVQTAAGSVVFSTDMVKARRTGSGESVVVEIPSQVFRAGEYEVALLGRDQGGRFEEAAYYYFNVQ